MSLELCDPPDAYLRPNADKVSTRADAAPGAREEDDPNACDHPWDVCGQFMVAMSFRVRKHAPAHAAPQPRTRRRAVLTW